MAAKNSPNLTDEDRYNLICDSLSRAREAGTAIKYNDFIRKIFKALLSTKQRACFASHIQ